MPYTDALSQARREDARRLYDANESFAEIARVLEVSQTTARKMARQLGWPRREPLKPFARRRTAGEGEAEAVDPKRLIARVEDSVRKQLASAERRLSRSSIANAERNARILASLVKSLAELQRLNREAFDQTRAGGASDDEAGPAVDMDRLRDELASTLARIRGDQPAGHSA